MLHILKLRDGEEFIKLGQVLKAAGIADSGIDAKEMIIQGLVTVDGEVETRRGRKIYDGMEVCYDDEKVSVQK
ncbi:MAG: RNA-binding S4 domain-containing protein [Lachnospiraceae bacterium]|nr:RNA-binding S4 domain-containing protein [Lachnospiraceae bacterium]